MSQEEAPLLRTKLHRPGPAPDALLRPRLMGAMQTRRDASLTLVCAPAGSGKSTLVSQWIDATGETAGWLSLGDRDNEPSTFFRYFVAAIHDTNPEACQASLSAARAENVWDTKPLAELLINDLLNLAERAVVVLDDFHRIRSQEIPRLLALLLERPLPKFHLVIVSRRDPQMPLASLRAAGRLHELRMGALRFSPEESFAFVSQFFPSEAPDELRELVRRADGWAVALRLLVLRMGSPPDLATVMGKLPPVANDVRDYLVAEILEPLPPARLSILMRLSIVERFCAPLCEQLCDEKGFDGEEFVNWLVKSGLFPIPLDEERHWFRFHHYFQEVLVSRLAQELDEAALGDLHARASHWFEQEGLLDEAFEHGLKTPDCIRAADLIALPKHPLPLDDFRLISGWLRRLPDKTAESRPGTLVELLWQTVRDGRTAEIESQLERLEELLEQQTWHPRETTLVRTALHTLRLEVHFYHGRLSEVVSCGEQALAEICEDNPISRQSVYMPYAIALTKLGQASRARQALRDAITEMTDPSQAALIYSTECQIEALSLNIPALKRAADRYVAFQEEQNNESDRPWTRYLAALARYQANELEEAHDILSVVSTEPGDGYDSAFFRQASLNASILFAQGRHRDAMNAAEALRYMMLERSNSKEAVLAKALGIEFAIRSGEVPRCAAWFDSFDASKPTVPFLYPGRFLIYLRTALALDTPEARAKAAEVLAVLFAKIEESACPADEVEIRALRALLHEAEGMKSEAVEDLGRAVALAAPGGALRVLADYGPDLAPILRRLKLNETGLDYVGRVLAILDLGQEGDKRPKPLVDALSKREFEILHLLAQRHSNKVIAEQLFISVETVKRHVANILGKLGVNRRADAVAKAEALGLLH